MRQIAFSTIRSLGVITTLIALAGCGGGQTSPKASGTTDSKVSDNGVSSATNPATNAAPADKKAEIAGGSPTKSGSGSKEAADGDQPYRLTLFEVDRPAFAYTLKTPVKVDAGAAPTLTKSSEKKNKITDDAEWFEKNGLSLAGRKPTKGPTYPTVSSGELATLGDDKLHYLLDHGDHSILMYGANFTATTTLVLRDKDQIARGQFDFSAWVKPAEVVAGEEQFTKGEVVWAQKVDDILYVSTMHHTYAKSSKGKNAFISAIGVNDGELRWQSEPLVCNAQNFVIRGAYIICGYGFTQEPDFLYVISRADGKTISKTPLKNGPSYLVMKGNQLFVRAYDTDYVFDIK